MLVKFTSMGGWGKSRFSSSGNKEGQLTANFVIPQHLLFRILIKVLLWHNIAYFLKQKPYLLSLKVQRTNCSAYFYSRQKHNKCKLVNLSHWLLYCIPL